MRVRQGVSERGGWGREEGERWWEREKRRRCAYWALEQQVCAKPVEHDTQYRRVSLQRTSHESSPDRFHADLGGHCLKKVSTTSCQVRQYMIAHVAGP